MKRIALTLVSIFAVLLICEGKEQYIYTQISQADGLSSTVNCIHKEPYKDVWLGAANGLYRFNGYDIKHYDDSLFKGSEIYQISADKEGNLWFLTDKWLIRKKADKEEFHKVLINNDETKRPYFSICHDDKGIYFGSTGKILRYLYENDSLSVFCE